MNLMLFNLKTDSSDSVLGFTTAWIRELAKQVDHISVITMCSGKIEVPDNVEVFSMGKEKGYSEPHRALRFYCLLFRILKSQKIDACFAHMSPLFVAMAGPILRLKAIPQVLWYTHKSVTFALKLGVFFSDIVVTAADGSFRVSTPKKKVIGHGVDTELFRLRSQLVENNRPFRIISVGRIMPVKRLELAIEALDIIRSRHPEKQVELVLIGDSYGTEEGQAYLAQLKQQVAQYGLTEHIHFAGAVPYNEVWRVYQEADCFVNLAETGGIDKAVLEAMASGVVVVVVNRSFEEVLGPQLAKDWVVNWNVEQLSERLVYLLEMPLQEREALGERMRKIVVDDHDLKKLTSRVIAECKGLVESNLVTLKEISR